MQIQRKAASKLLDRELVVATIEGKAGRVSRKEAVSMLAQELGVSEERIGLVRLDGGSGNADVRGRFFVYGSKESLARLHPKYLDERSLSKEERDKLKAERKKAKAPAPAAEAKK